MRKIITISVDTTEDTDIINYLTGLPNGSQSSFIREAIRAYISGQQPDVSNQQVIDTLLTAISNLQIVGTDTNQPAEAPEFSDALNGLGEW